MARDIEEFLRKAAERRAQQKTGNQPQQKTPPRQQPARREEPIVVEGIEIVEVPTASSAEPRKMGQLKERLKVKHEAEDMRRQSVSEHVKSHIDTSSVTRRADQLGDRIASVHDRVESQVHAHLDHDISKVDDKPTITDDPSPAIFGKKDMSVPNQLKAMLSDPDQVGNAILLAEILKRPDFD